MVMNKNNLGVLRRRRRASGTEVVEAAITLPLILLLLLGLLQYGHLLYRTHQITNAARHGARLAALPDATTNGVRAQIDQLMSNAGFSSGDYTVTFTPGNIADAQPGEQVEVRVQVAGSNVALMQTSFIPVPSNVHGRVVMAKEGP